MIDLEIDRISAAVHALRPDWPTASIRTLIDGKFRDRNRLDMAVALVWVACDSTSVTPARVCESGPWWQAVRCFDATGTYRPARKDEDCEHHPGDYAKHCRGCAADRLAGDETAPRRDTHDRSRVSQHVAEIRAQIAARRTEREDAR